MTRIRLLWHSSTPADYELNKMSSDQATLLLDTLKVFLKQHGITYKELAQRCKLSEVSIKRLLNRPHIGLDQLLQLCQAAGSDLPSLLQLSSEINAEISLQMAEEQADVIFKQPALLSIFTIILGGIRSVNAISQHFNINLPSAYIYARKLEKLNYISLEDDAIKLIFPLQTALGPQTNLDATAMLIQRIFESIHQFMIEQGVNPPDDFAGGIYAGQLVLNDNEYKQYNEELEKLVGLYQRKSLANIKLPNRRNKLREQFIMLMPHVITQPFPVENLVQEVAK